MESPFSLAQRGESQKSTKEAVPRLRWWYKLSTVPNSEIIFFVRHLGVMLRAGLSLAAALKTLSEQTKNKKFSYVLSIIYQKVNQGQALSDSIALFPKIFNEVFINMVRAGEASGQYEEVLNQIYLQMKKAHELKRKVKGAMTYPIIVIIVMILIGVAMLIFVIPKLTSIFKETDVALPFATRILIAFSDFMIANGILVAFITIVSLTGMILFFRIEKPKYYLHAILLKLPILGKILLKINIARLARTLGSLLKTDISIIESFQITARVINSRPYRKAIQEASVSVKKGNTMHSALIRYPKLFPPLITQMVLVGEETGSLDDILKELADFFEEEVHQTMDNLPSIIEPVLIVLLGLGVGGMAIALIMPLYTLTQAF